MLTVIDIISKWPSAAEMARDIGLRHPKHGAMMKMRRSIPAQYWAALVESAEKRGFDDVTLEALAQAHAMSPPTPPSPAPAAEDAA